MTRKSLEEDNRERWYYDACVLDKNKSAYAEMFNRTPTIQPIISHLSFGEAFANSYMKGQEKLDAFVSLITNLKTYIKVVQNDGSEKVLQEVRATFPALSITDAIHMATALENNCICIKTTDRDFCGLNSKKLNELGTKYSIPCFYINKK